VSTVRPLLPDDRLRAARRDPRPALFAKLAALFLAVLLTFGAGAGVADAAHMDAPKALLDTAKATLAAPERIQTRASPAGDEADGDALAPARSDAMRRPALPAAGPAAGRHPELASRWVSREARAPPAPAG
jgi:hypothetical protein